MCRDARILLATALAALLASCSPGGRGPAGEAIDREASMPPAATARSAPEVVVPPARQELADVRTTPATVKALTRAITASGQVAYDEARLARVTAWISGRVERLYVNATGAQVRRGAPLLAIYSPELLATQREYLVALDTADQLRGSAYPEVAEGARDMLDAARSRLRLWGVTAGQIERLARNRQPQATVSIAAPASGTVVRKLVQSGQYVNTGDVLFELADLSSVWIEAAVPESDLALVRPGQLMAASAAAYPGRTFRGTVSLVYPFLDEATRSVRVRAAFANHGGALKPGMYVQARLSSSLGRKLTVPASAVLQTGREPVVWVELDPGRFQQRRVKLGARAGDDYVVLGGLRAGERVASAGGFLLDAESQLGAAQGGAPPATVAATGQVAIDAGPTRVALRLPPGGAKVGMNAAELAFTEAGRAVAVEDVAAGIEMYMPGMPMKADAIVEPGAAAGRYKVMIAPPMQGTWTLTVSFKRQGRAAAVRFSVSAR